jgi:hypothetical protein
MRPMMNSSPSEKKPGCRPRFAWPWSSKVCSGVSREFGVTQGNRAIYSELRGDSAL